MNAIDVLNALQPFLNWLTEQSRVRQPVALEDPDTAGTYFVNADGEMLVHGTGRVDSRVLQPTALEDPDTAGTYFVNADGEMLVHGTKRVEPYIQIAE